MEALKVALAALFSAAELFAIAKLIGHKQVSQLDFFDYITGITIGSIGAEIATTLEEPWWKPSVALLTFGAVTVALSFITRKFPKSRKYINGTPTIIMNNGKLFRENMKKSKLELSEFMLMCRQEGYFNLEDIHTAVFECNGKLSILPVSGKRPLTPADMGLSPVQEHVSTEVIMEGRILNENLKRMGLNETWLKKQLKEQGYGSAKEIFLGICSSAKKLTVYENMNSL